MNENYFGDVAYFINACDVASFGRMTEKNDGDFLAELGMDGHKWAHAFAELFDGRTVKGDAPDENDHLTVNTGTLIGWFANAIMAGYDRGHRKGQDTSWQDLVRDLERHATRHA